MFPLKSLNYVFNQHSWLKAIVNQINEIIYHQLYSSEIEETTQTLGFSKMAHWIIRHLSMITMR